jgi:hypothetical protein
MEFVNLRFDILLQGKLSFILKVCNFLKDVFFLDIFTVKFVGSGSYIYKVIKANGKIT